MSPFMVITSSPYLRQLMQVNILPKEKYLLYYSVRLNFLHRGFSRSNWNCLQERFSLEHRLSNPKSRELVCETWDCYSPSAGGKPRAGGMWSLSSPHHMLRQQELIIDSPGRTSHLPQTAMSGTLAEMWRKGTYESWAFNWSWERERKGIFFCWLACISPRICEAWSLVADRLCYSSAQSTPVAAETTCARDCHPAWGAGCGARPSVLAKPNNAAELKT